MLRVRRGLVPRHVAPGTNRFCSVAGLGHDETPLSVLLPMAFEELFLRGIEEGHK